MSRVALIDAANAAPAAQPFYANGDPGPVPASLAQVPDLMAAALPFIGRAFAPTTLDARTKEIVILRVSAQARCRYCTQTHSVVAMGAGLSPEEVGALRGDRAVESTFTARRDRALITWADAIAATPQGVGDAAFAALSALFSQPEIVELTVVAGLTLLLNRYATALDLPVHPAHAAELARFGW
ncbi:MAG: carboxymuconolactone decarboxylase family protein [SAR202 cluster bacterium]|nr:carboxymuconolactone decarboxylase family protein [SAR202 cluster bacterium]